MADTATASAAVELTLIDRITGPMRKMQARFAKLTRGLGFERIGAAASKVGARIKGLGDGLARTSGRLTSVIGLLGAGTAGVIAGAFGLAKSAADIGSEIGETAYKLGIGVEALQEYRFAAKMAGIEAATFDKGVEKLGINAVEAAKGSKTLAKDFRSLGVAVKGSNGKMRPTEDILNDTMSALADIEDPLRRNQLAYKLLGKSGVDLVKMLGSGAGGLRDMRAEARALGIVMSQDAIDAADAFGDNLDSLTERLRGLKLLIGVQFLPVLNELTSGFNSWFDANAKFVRSTIVDWCKKLSNVLRDLVNPASDIRKQIAGIGENFSSLVGGLRPVVDFLGGPMQAVLIGVAAWIAGPLISAVALLTGSFINLGVAIMATPFGWILGGVALVAASVYVLYQKWDEFLAYWSGLWGRVTDAFDKGFIQGIGTLLKELNLVVHVARGMDAVLEYLTGFSLLDAGTRIMETLWDGLKSKWGEELTWFKGQIKDLVGWLPESIQTQLGFSAEPVSDNGGSKESTGRQSIRAPGIEPIRLPALPGDDEALGSSIADALGAAWRDLTKPIGAVATPPLPGDSDHTSVGASISSALSAAWRDLTKPIGAVATPPTVPSAAPPTQTETVQAGSVDTERLNIVEPLTLSQPQTIDASSTITLTINAPGADANQIARTIKQALQERDVKKRADIRSSLSD